MVTIEKEGASGKREAGKGDTEDVSMSQIQ